MRRLLLALLLLAALGVAADFGVARLFESRVTAALERRYDLGSRPVVQVRDFPFLPHLATGRLGAIDLAADGARAEGITFSSLEVHLRGVTVPRRVLLGGSGRVRVDRVDGQVELSESQVNLLLAEHLQGGSLVIDATGVRLRVRTDVLGRPVTALLAGRLGVRSGRIVFVPASVQVGDGRDPVLATRLASRFSFDVPLPPLPAGIMVERIDTEPGALVLVGHAGGLEVAA